MLNKFCKSKKGNVRKKEKRLNLTMLPRCHLFMSQYIKTKKSKTFFLLIFSFLLLSLKAYASGITGFQNESLPDDLIQNIFRKPIYFGASLTAESRKRSLMLNLIIDLIGSKKSDWRPGINGGNPSHLAVKQMVEPVIGSRAEQYFIHYPGILNIDVTAFLSHFGYDFSTNPYFETDRESSYYGGGPRDVFSLRDLVTEPFQGLNFAHPKSNYEKSKFPYQIYQFIAHDGVLKHFYENATALMSVDALFWVGMEPTPEYCDESYFDYRRTFESVQYVDDERVVQIQEIPTNIHKIIPEFIDKAFHDQKVTILGNISEEREELVNIQPQYFSFPNDDNYCLKTINALLEAHCTSEKNCYLVDLHELLGLLQTDLLDIHGNHAYEKVDESGNRKGYSYYEMRVSDGVHLTPIGTQILANVIEGLLRANPPRF